MWLRCLIATAAAAFVGGCLGIAGISGDYREGEASSEGPGGQANVPTSTAASGAAASGDAVASGGAAAGPGGRGGSSLGGAGGGGAPSWQVVDTLTVPSDGTIVTSNVSLESGVMYRLIASGTFLTNPTNDWFADAEYIDFPNTVDVGSGIDFGLAIDDILPDASKTPHWGSYSPSHSYELPWTGEGSPIQAQIHDQVYGNNSGSLTLEILQLL